MMNLLSDADKEEWRYLKAERIAIMEANEATRAEIQGELMRMAEERSKNGRANI